MLNPEKVKKEFNERILTLLCELNVESAEICVEDDELKLIIFNKGEILTINLGYALEVNRKV